AVSLDGGTASFDTKNVGTGKTVTLSGFALSGDDADNYTLSGVATTTANINQKELTVTAVNNSKVCGQANPELAVSYSGFVTGENEDILDVKPTASTSADGNSTNSSYAIIASGGEDNNYSFKY